MSEQKPNAEAGPVERPVRPLCERLRERAGQCDWHREIELEAADEIERLRDALAYAVAEADGWHDDCRGGRIMDDPKMEAARALVRPNAIAHRPVEAEGRNGSGGATGCAAKGMDE